MHSENKNKGQKIPIWSKLKHFKTTTITKTTIKNRQYMSINKYHANKFDIKTVMYQWQN